MVAEDHGTAECRVALVAKYVEPFNYRVSFSCWFLGLCDCRVQIRFYFGRQKDHVFSASLSYRLPRAMVLQSAEYILLFVAKKSHVTTALASLFCSQGYATVELASLIDCL